MIITPVQNVQSHRTGTISGMTAEKISALLGFTPNVDDDPYKVENSWAAEVSDLPGYFDDEFFPIAVWDYKGSHHRGQFSCYGQPEVLLSIFGNNYSKD